MAVNCARITHQAPLTLDAVRYFAALLAGALEGAGKEELMAPDFSPVPGIWDAAPMKPRIQQVAAGSWRGSKPRAQRPRRGRRPARTRSRAVGLRAGQQSAGMPRCGGEPGCRSRHDDRYGRATGGRALRRGGVAARMARGARPRRRNRSDGRCALRGGPAHDEESACWCWSTRPWCRRRPRGSHGAADRRVPHRVRRDHAAAPMRATKCGRSASATASASCARRSGNGSRRSASTCWRSSAAS